MALVLINLLFTDPPQEDLENLAMCCKVEDFLLIVTYMMISPLHNPKKIIATDQKLD